MIRLRIADVLLDVSCEHEVAQLLTFQYQGFAVDDVAMHHASLHDDAGPPWRVTAQFMPTAPDDDTPFRLELDRRSTPWTLQSRSFHSRIDPQKRLIDVRYAIRSPYPEGFIPTGLQLALKAATCLITILDGGLALHGSGVILGGVALAFLGASEAGKTTMATQLESAAAATLLADDIVLATARDSDIVLHATPFSGNGQPVHTRRRGSAPWRHCFGLVQATDNFGVRPLSATEAYRLLARCLLAPHGDSALETQVLRQAEAYRAALRWHEAAFDLDPQRTATTIHAALATEAPAS